jgi:hypothetical protein
LLHAPHLQKRAGPNPDLHIVSELEARHEPSHRGSFDLGTNARRHILSAGGAGNTPKEVCRRGRHMAAQLTCRRAYPRIGIQPTSTASGRCAPLPFSGAPKEPQGFAGEGVLWEKTVPGSPSRHGGRARRTAASDQAYGSTHRRRHTPELSTS